MVRSSLFMAQFVSKFHVKENFNTERERERERERDVKKRLQIHCDLEVEEAFEVSFLNNIFTCLE